MPANTKNLLTDVGGLPIPQAFEASSDSFKPVGSKDGGMLVNFAGASAVKHGVVTLQGAGQAAQLPGTSCSQVMITALGTNTGFIYVGGTGVSATNYGKRLKADDFVILPVQDPSLLSIVASVDGEGVSYFAL